MCSNCSAVIKELGIHFQREVDLDYSEIELSNRKMQTLLGFKDRPAEEPFLSLIDKCLELARYNCQIKAGFVEIPLDDLNEENCSIITHDIIDNKIEFNVNKIIFHSIKKSERLLVFVCTAGKEICELSRKMSDEGDTLDSYILDTIGSEIVEVAMDKIQDDLEKSYRLIGDNITNRYSPGYCDWHVSEQQKLFRLLPHNFCGITLTSSSLMIPAKSISGIIGIGKNVKRKGYSCSACNIGNCIYKRLKN